MRNLFASLIFFFFYLQGFSQSYAYSFKGNLNESQQQIVIQEIKKIQGIKTVELRYKMDSERGEILFSIEIMDSEGENEIEFSPLSIKEILIEKGLSPIDFRQLK